MRGSGREAGAQSERDFARFPLPCPPPNLGEGVGGIIMSRVMRDKAILPQQIMLYRDFVRAVFLGA